MVHSSEARDTIRRELLIKHWQLFALTVKKTGEPIAFIVNYAVHGVVMYANHYVVNEDGTYGVGVSADLPGYVSTSIENSYDGAVALWISGAAGDQNPIIGNEYFVPDTTTGEKQTKYFSKSAVEILEYLGSVQYADVLRANENITEMSSCLLYTSPSPRD